MRKTMAKISSKSDLYISSYDFLKFKQVFGIKLVLFLAQDTWQHQSARI